MIKKILLLLFFTFWILTPSLSLGSENLQSLQAGYHDGFYIKTENDRYRLKVGTRLNFGYTYGFVSPAQDFSSFDVMHAKFYAGGNAFSRNIQYYVQAAAANNTRQVGFGVNPESNTGDFTLEDYYVRLAWNHMSVKLGQYKVPFGRQWMIYSGNMEFVDRSIATGVFTFGRDRGITLNGNRETFQYTLGIFNGGGAPALGSGFLPSSFNSNGQNVSNDTAGGGLGHLYVVRFVGTPLGAAGYSEGDVESSEGNRLEVGVGFIFDDGRDVDTNGDNVVDDTGADLMNLATDIVWKHAGKSFQAEFFYRHLNGSISPDIEAMGFYVQPGYFLIPDQLEIAFRFSWVDPDMDTSDDALFEAAAASNLYLSEDHRYKVQFQYSWRAQENALGGRNDDSFIDLMFQLTL